MALKALSTLFLTALLTPFPALSQQVETVLSGLDYPWDIEARDGAIYVTEKAGTLGVLRGGVFQRDPVATTQSILNDRGGGLMGMALRPDFEQTGRIILYHHYGTSDARRNRVIEVEHQGGVWQEVRVLLDDIPGHPLYNGGRVAFGPDGMLYVTTGWTENRALPQSMDSLAGKILRLTPDGQIPADNPFQGSAIWSLGHRNPQGLAWTDHGTLYAAEHGQSANDEINLIVPGGNYGWPLVEGADIRDGMKPPEVHSGSGTWAPSGLAWDGRRLLMASLRQEGILAYVPGEPAVSNALDLGERVRDVAVTADGIYAITTNRSPRRDGPSRDRLIRVQR